MQHTVRRCGLAMTTPAQRLRAIGLGVRWMSALPPHTLLPMPSLSPTMTSGNLAAWKLKAGDSFGAGDVLAEIETDKATVDYESVDDGFIAKILVAEGYAHATFPPDVGLCMIHRSAPAAHAERRMWPSTRPSPWSSKTRRASQRSRILSPTPVLMLRLQLQQRQPPPLRPVLPPRLPTRQHRCPRHPQRVSAV